ncbi:MAG: ParB/RepB/Spo0J family partition protein [Flavobacteriales bacterium]|nr:ParB/RepB/Spo0J family partition protein [Flavobacteriales bacterium]
MNKKQNGLGKGLGAILPIAEKFVEIPLSNIQANPFQPRKKFNQQALEELASSIKELGIIQPITVRKLGFEKYQLISGERRFRASQVAGLIKIPAFVKVADDKEMLEMALVENIQRIDLNPIEVALSYKRLIEECNLTQEECSERVGKNRTTITNFLRILKLPEQVQVGLQNQKISMGHARALLSLKDKQSQINLFHDIVENGASVREVEQMVRDFAETDYKRTSKDKKVRIVNPLPFDKQRKMHELSNYLDREVQLKTNKKGKGKLIIPFSSDEDFEEILSLIKSNS